MDLEAITTKASHLTTILATENLEKLLHSALEHLFEVVSLYSFPLSIKLSQFSDEFFLLIDLVLHGYNLCHHSAGWTERNYGLVRRYDEKVSRRTFLLRSLVQLTALPYVLRKLKDILSQLSREKWNQKIMLRLQTCLRYFTSLLTLRSIVRFLASRSAHCSPQQEVIGVHLQRRTQTDVEHSKQLLRKEGLCIKVVDLLFRSAFRAMAAGSLATQLWASSSEDIKALLKPPLDRPKLPPIKLSTSIGHCPICREEFEKPTAVQPSGIVYCYDCIVKFVEEKARCPVSKMTVSMNQLIVLFD
ncbi:hypothetical protein RvY_15388 [Ramazzottius varieornatus]|uniref:Peroxisome assembly protein 12 n=1 Tax=Ramazzottius varieornatus TaxID=947166 RepID=A0A1D1VW09_RAMVA|nr:hypothetical protein RvY_15388 [Ramazzottius varieornatus]